VSHETIYRSLFMFFTGKADRRPFQPQRIAQGCFYPRRRTTALDSFFRASAAVSRRSMIRPQVSVPMMKNPIGDNLRSRYGRTRLRTNRSGECESDHARENQDNTCNSNSEEAFRSELIPHGTPPITKPLLEGNDATRLAPT
jgi:hypothetical protein